MLYMNRHHKSNLKVCFLLYLDPNRDAFKAPERYLFCPNKSSKQAKNKAFSGRLGKVFFRSHNNVFVPTGNCNNLKIKLKSGVIVIAAVNIVTTFLIFSKYFTNFYQAGYCKVSKNNLFHSALIKY